MEIIRDLHNIRPRHRGCVMTMGNFDGVHLGHRLLLDRLVEKSIELALPSLLVTLEPLPREFFKGRAMPGRLTRLREKIHLLQQTQLDRVLLIPFDEQMSNRTAEWFIEQLAVRLLDVKYIIVGDDSRFGQGAKGDIRMLQDAGERLGFGVSHIDTLNSGQRRVSSSRIRELLAAGDLHEAEQLLGHRYFIMGRVVYGRQVGRQLGVRTANLRLQRYRAALEGVFAVEVEGLDRNYQGVANIGVRPTVEGKEPLLEVHLFDFNDDIYGRQLTVIFRQFIRQEKKFADLDALRTQIDQDIRDARRWFANNVEHGKEAVTDDE